MTKMRKWMACLFVFFCLVFVSGKYDTTFAECADGDPDCQEVTDYWIWLGTWVRVSHFEPKDLPPDRCETNPESCNAEDLECDKATNSACEGLAGADSACNSGTCPKPFYKVLIGDSGNALFGACDSDLSNDYPAVGDKLDIEGVSLIGFTNEFMAFPDMDFANTVCRGQHRNYAYIYIPDGWWSFGIKSNQSTVVDLAKACGYCDNNTPIEFYEIPGSPCCGGNVYSWIAASGAGTGASHYVAPTPTKATLVDNFSDYSSLWKSLINFDYNDVTLLPEAPADDTTPLALGLGVPYSYTWVEGKILYEDGDDLMDGNLHDGRSEGINVVALGDGPESDTSTTHSFLANFGGNKQINGFYLQTYAQPGVWVPPVINLYCNGTTLVGHGEYQNNPGSDVQDIYVPVNGSCSTMKVTFSGFSVDAQAWLYEAVFLGETGTNGSGGSSITLWAYGSVNTSNGIFDDNGGYPVMQLYVKGSLVKTFYEGRTTEGTLAPYSYAHSSAVKPEEIRVVFVNNTHGHPDKYDPGKVLTVDRMILNGVTYLTDAASTYSRVTTNLDDPCPQGIGFKQVDSLSCNGYFIYNLLGSREDTVWSTASYYEAGWYPVELSAYWSQRFLYNPQLWWKGSSGTGGRYSNGVSNGLAEARISSCSPGEVDCQCVRGSTPRTLDGGSQNQTVSNIVKLTGYDSSETPVVRSSNQNVIKNANITNVSVSSTGWVSAVVDVEDVTETLSTVLSVTADAAATDGEVCALDCNITITVSPTRDFWQVKDMDVTTTGDLESILRGGYFDEAGDGTYPGIPVFGGGYTFGDGEVSEEKGWLVDTTLSDVSYLGYSYAFFEKQAPEGISSLGDDTILNFAGLVDGATVEGGYSWIKYGSLTFKDSDIVIPTGSKVVVFVDGSLIVEKNITLQSHGTTFLMFVVSGDITIGQDVANLEGIFFTDGNFSTGAGDDTLNVHGSVVAKGRVYLDRDLASGSVDPSEYFTYAPDLFLSIPYEFGSRVMSWREVSPTSPE